MQCEAVFVCADGAVMQFEGKDDNPTRMHWLCPTTFDSWLSCITRQNGRLNLPTIDIDDQSMQL